MTQSSAIVERLHGLYPKLIDLSLGRVLRLLGQLGNPQHHLPPVIHVAGTNGKGSTCAFLRAIGEAAGLRVHVTISPHLIDLRERFSRGGFAGIGGGSEPGACRGGAGERRRADYRVRGVGGGRNSAVLPHARRSVRGGGGSGRPLRCDQRVPCAGGLRHHVDLGSTTRIFSANGSIASPGKRPASSSLAARRRRVGRLRR